MSDKKTKKRDIVHRLCEKAAMIHLGEKIEFGSETRLMWEAADEIERLRSALAAARPHIMDEAARKEDEKHRQWCIGKGRDPDKYRSQYSIAAAAIRAAKDV